MLQRLVRFALIPLAVALLGANGGLLTTRATSRPIIEWAAQPGEGGQLGAAIFSGSCDGRDEQEAFALNTLEPRDVGDAATSVLASFTEVETTLADLVARSYAVAVLDATGEPIACGEIGGGPAGANRYLGLREANESGYVGVAWLFGQGAQTQVSLFLGQGLTDARARAEATAVADQPTNAFISETYEFSLTWDESWAVVERGTQSDANDNPADFVSLSNGISYIEVTGFTSAREPEECVSNFTSNASESEAVSNWEPRLGADGQPLRGADDQSAFAVNNLTYTTQDSVRPMTIYFSCLSLEPGERLLSIFHFVVRNAYDNQVAARDNLLAGLTLPAD